MSDEKPVFVRPTSMEPLLPQTGRNTLADLSCDILKSAGKLTGQVHSPKVLEEVAKLTREMNCYYSNLIEGHRTTPRQIERALKQQFDDDSEQRDNQLLSLAHIETETLMEHQLATQSIDVYSPGFVQWLHREFYQRLPEALHWSQSHDGSRYKIAPGELRSFMVDVGAHTPPRHAELPEFLDRFHAFYSSKRIHATERLVAIAAAHHRLAWIHPFGDGNGRVARLHSHALFRHHQIGGHGLWTLSRGLARSRSKYYSSLAQADAERRSDLDGRGNLSDAGLFAFCEYFLETVLDQIKFMSGLLDLPTLRKRVERYFQFEAMHLASHREALMRVVRTLVDEGEIQRTRVQEITGKGATVSAEIVKLGLSEGFFSTPSPKGPLRIAFPEKILSSYFPGLYLDLPES